jgi:phosphohistidine phosphatase
MLLYIVRHGKAEADAPTGHDADRRLTDRGRSQAEHLADRLAGSAEPPAMIYSSGHTRAWSTASIIAAALGVSPSRHTALELGHTSSAAVDLIAELRLGDDSRAVMLVGHNPQLERLAGVLLGGPAATRLELRTGQMLVMDFDDGAEPGAGRLVDSVRLEGD